MFSMPQKLEEAAAALVTALGLSVTVNRNGEETEVPLAVQVGITDDDKAVPSITMAALSGDEFPQSSGNFRLNFTAEIKSNADETTLEAHRALCEAALVPLMSDDSETQLSGAVANFACIGISQRQCNERVEDRSWVTQFSFEAYCAGLSLV